MHRSQALSVLGQTPWLGQQHVETLPWPAPTAGNRRVAVEQLEQDLVELVEHAGINPAVQPRHP
ncbi:hypothetical protein [Micromonospora kangleipakensis]|uniref:hypothetical protein n=1 Tax=Micromonospora kangleipakensis TaxID=1077942 RepID=UPI0010297540|nr:hypothetical protein [Micromonospora kangleipakensis]